MKSTAAGGLFRARISSPAFGVPGTGVGVERARPAGRGARYGLAKTRSTAGACGARCRIDGTTARISVRNGRRGDVGRVDLAVEDQVR